MRASIIDGTFPDWVRNFTHKLYGGPDKVEAWVRDALAVAGIEV